MSDAERITALERRLGLLEDKDAIRALRDSYHACINDGHYDQIAELFTDDAVVELGYLARYEGREAINTGFRGMGERERFFIKQYIHSHQIQVAGRRGHRRLVPGGTLWPLRRFISRLRPLRRPLPARRRRLALRGDDRDPILHRARRGRLDRR